MSSPENFLDLASLCFYRLRFINKRGKGGGKGSHTRGDSYNPVDGVRRERLD